MTHKNGQREIGGALPKARQVVPVRKNLSCDEVDVAPYLDVVEFSANVDVFC